MHDFMKTILLALKEWVNKRIKNNTPNWNENNPEADGYIKNRPFYRDETKTETVVQTTSFITPSPYWWDEPFVFIPIVGETYKITFDGKEYICAAYSDQYGGKCIGNLAITNASGLEDTGEPFFYYWLNNEDYSVCIRDQGEHTIAIEKINVTKIDELYLPSNLAKTEELLALNGYVSDLEYQVDNKVSYTPQNFDASSKKIARNNIDAVSAEEAIIYKNTHEETVTWNGNTANATTMQFNGRTYYLIPEAPIYSFDQLATNSVQATLSNGTTRIHTAYEGVNKCYSLGSNAETIVVVEVPKTSCSLPNYYGSSRNTVFVPKVAGVYTRGGSPYWTSFIYSVKDNGTNIYMPTYETGTKIPVKLNENGTFFEEHIPQQLVDWNENDSSIKGYIHNRTHYEEIIPGDILVETTGGTVVETGLSEKSALYRALDEISYHHTEFTVKINNETYQDKYTFDIYKTASFHIGNLYLYDANQMNTGEDYLCLFIYEMVEGADDITTLITYAHGQLTTASDSVVIKLVDKPLVHTLDEKFIPNTIARTSEIPSTVGLATETYVNTKVASLVDSAPETLDTLNELAAALGDDPNFATTMATKLGELETAVDNFEVPNSNLVNGSAEGSLRTIRSMQEDSNYTMGPHAFAEGDWTMAEGNSSHAEGYSTKAFGETCHAEGNSTSADGACSHAEGYMSSVEGFGSHAEGFATCAYGRGQHVEGEFNIPDEVDEVRDRGQYLHIAGNGSWDNQTESNAYTLDWSGNGWFAGDVYVGSTSGTNKDEGSKKLATEDFVTAALTALGLPVPTAADAGKILRVNARGKYELVSIANAEEATF